MQYPGSEDWKEIVRVPGGFIYVQQFKQGMFYCKNRTYWMESYIQKTHAVGQEYPSVTGRILYDTGDVYEGEYNQFGIPHG